MNCYEFETNISAYIDGDLNQANWKGFTDHKKNCQNCCEKFDDITQQINFMHRIKPVSTSEDFLQNLHKKIDQHQSKKSFITKFLEFKPFGMNPMPALGFSAAIALLVVSSFMVFNEDSVPVVDLDKLKDQNLNVPADQMRIQQPPVLLASDVDTTKDGSNTTRPNFDSQMHLVNQP